MTETNDSGNGLPEKGNRCSRCKGLGIVRDKLDPFGGSADCPECGGDGRAD